MVNLQNAFQTLQKLNGTKYHYYSLDAFEKQGHSIRRLPISLKIILESLLRNCDGKIVKEEDVLRLVQWDSKKPQARDIPFIVSRVILQDFTGVPLLVDLAAMRDAVAKQGKDALLVEPQVPVDLVVDHSVQVDRAGTDDSFVFNLQLEFARNKERYEFLKWGQKAFKTFRVVPPGIGIVHQVNLEMLATVVSSKEVGGNFVLFPDTLVGTDSHTTMINGLGIVGWGVGGIEAEAAMLNQPVSLQFPEVIGIHLSGSLREGATATDLALTVTEMLRKEKVVGKFVEFFGEGVANLTVADRATIANMAPEYGATMGYFPLDEETLKYLETTGRKKEHIDLIRKYLTAQNLFGAPKMGEVEYTKTLELDLHAIVPSVSGPKRPQDRIALSAIKTKFNTLLKEPVASGGYGKDLLQKPRICVHPGGAFSLQSTHDTGGISEIEEKKGGVSWDEVEMVTNRPITTSHANPGYTESIACDAIMTHGSVVIAAITSCTNTSNPEVMIAAGLVAKKACEKGLKINPLVKTSLAPGSRVVTDYLYKTGLQKYLDQLGFQLVAYGCTTCIGNSGPLDERIDKAIKDHDIIAASVLSGNRNFEARIHSSVKANFLMSPPLVVAFAIAGRVDIDMASEPIGYDAEGLPVFLKDVWPTSKEIKDEISKGISPEMFKKRYAKAFEDNPAWLKIDMKASAEYPWNTSSTYIQKPPYFQNFSGKAEAIPDLKNLRALALFGDSVTTDHISPAGSFHKDTPAGQYLISKGISPDEFNSYGSRRGNHEVMMRGTFANVRIRNAIAGGKEGGYTKLFPENKVMPIFDACQIYAERKESLIVFAGKDYGMGSSRDWAAKGAALLGVRAVVARSFERIHRSNLIGMGVLPLEFLPDDSWESLKIEGDELFSLTGLEKEIKPMQKVELEIVKNGKRSKIQLLSRLDSQIEVDYYLHGGIMPYVLRQL